MYILFVSVCDVGYPEIGYSISRRIHGRLVGRKRQTHAHHTDKRGWWGWFGNTTTNNINSLILSVSLQTRRRVLPPQILRITTSHVYQFIHFGICLACSSDGKRFSEQIPESVEIVCVVLSF